MDFLPTLAKLTGCSVPSDRIIDGNDIWPLMTGRVDRASPSEVFYYYAGTWLQAVRSRPWKLRLANPELRKPIYGECEAWFTLKADAISKPQLYNLESDLNEKYNVADQYPEIVKQLEILANEAREDIGDYNHPGKNSRPMGFANSNYPLARDWISSPDEKESTEAMLKEMRTFQKRRFDLLKDSTDLQPGKKKNSNIIIKMQRRFFSINLI